MTTINGGPKFQRVQIVKRAKKIDTRQVMFAVCSLKNIALINTDLDAPKISRSHIVFAYNSLYVPRGKRGEKNPVHLSRCKLRRNTGHFFSISATDLLVMHLVGEDR